MTKPKLYFSLLLLFVSFYITAQISENVVPYSASGNLPEVSSYVEMKPFDQAAFIRENTLRPTNNIKTFTFAKAFETDMTPENSGKWQPVIEGRVWRLGISSANAYSLYLTLNSFHLNKGVKLFVYSPGYVVLRGAFTTRNNNPNKVLSVAPVPGDSVIVELDVPSGVTDYGGLRIAKVYHDCMGEFVKNNSSFLKSAQISACPQYINCGNGKYWQTEKNAVCRLVINGELCSGALIGNTSDTQDPYLLTAYHCIFDSVHAAEAIYYLQYEYPTCDGKFIINWQTVSGSSLMATTDHKLDFALVKLNNVPPVSYHPYYAGWDISDAAPQSGVCIHHPWGEPKQIAIDYHPLQTATIGLDFDTLSDWEVSRWSIGATQPGSSGAPLFNEHHKIVGNLAGGEATCDDPINDYFNKFSVSWDKYPDPKNQLKAWLDPTNTGLTSIDGYDPYGFSQDNCDTTWNFQSYQPLVLSRSGLQWGWVSGQNSDQLTQFAEKFISETSIKLPGVFFRVAKAYNAQPLSNIEVKVWEGNTLPENEKYTKTIFIRDLKPDAVNYISFDSIITVTGNFFIGYKVNYTDPVDSFAVFHTINPANTGVSSMYVYNGSWQNINSIASIGLSASLGIGITECYGKVEKPESNTVNIYPNPCIDHLYIDIPTGLVINNVECFDITGRRVSYNFIFSEENNELQFQLPTGMYVVRITTDEKVFFKKFMVVKNK